MQISTTASLGDSVVLLCEDEPLDAERVRRLLHDDPRGRAELLHETTLGGGLRRLAEHSVDVVLLDLHLPDSDGIETVLRLRAEDPSVPLVVFTGAADEETAVAALTAGAHDYLVKDEIGAPQLRRSIRYAIERRRIAEENRRLEHRLSEVEKLESLGTLCAGMTFGFNTQLGTILDYCSEALADVGAGPRTPELRHALIEINRAACMAAEMVQRLRDYSELDRSESDEVELSSFLVEIADFLGTIALPDIDVACDAVWNPLRVRIPRQELQRMLMSLVVNAAEAVADGPGSISVSTGVVDVDEEILAEAYGCPDATPGRYAYLRVADTGAGLERARRERIFDPYYSTKYAGRGLGLASVLGILHRHRGVVRVDPNQPTGSVFTVMLPLVGGAPIDLH